MYYIVTGAAGFIGANIVKGLNERGITDIIAVDNMKKADKFKNLVDCEIADYLDKEDFLDLFLDGAFEGDVAAVFHEGACSDTMETDGRYMMENNYRYTVALLDYCQNEEVPLLYASSASVYGGGTVFSESRGHEGPLNVYGYSKFLFDQYVRRMWQHKTAQIAGFRYFNVYGPREQHKGRMASVAFHHFGELREGGKVRLFGEYGGYGPGEQTRDFVYVDDVVAVNLWFLRHPQRNGIFNVGTGRAQPFNDVAHATINATRSLRGEPPLSLEQQVKAGLIEYVAFPEALIGKYQCHTQADLARLRQSGCDVPFLDVAAGIERYAKWLAAEAR